MRLVIATGIYPPDHGGPARFVPQLAEAACERGWQVQVVTLSDDPTLVDNVAWKVHRIPRRFPKWRRIPITVRHLAVHLRQADVMFANGLFEEAALAATLARTPWVAKFVGDPVWERHRNQHPNAVDLETFAHERHRWQVRLQRRVLVGSLRRTSVVVTPSDQLARLLVGWGVDNVDMVPNGVPLTPVSDVPPSVDVVTVARLVPWKHIDTLIRACAGAGLSLDVVGDGPQHHELQQLIDALQPTEPIRLRGSLPATEIPGVLDSARVFALLSSYEGMSFALLEAMSRGKPVVVGDNPGNRAVVTNGENGLVVRSDDAEVVQQCLAALIADRDQRRLLGERARHTVEKRFSIDATLGRTLEHLERAAGMVTA
jgi:glycosyltransferase involved in cell wall biosynthesis